MVDGHYLVNVFQSLHALIRQRLTQRVVDVLRKDGIEGIVDEGRFARARNTRHADERSQWEIDRDVFQVVAFRPHNAQHLSVTFAAHRGNGYTPLPIEVFCGEGLAFEHLGRCTLKHHFAAFATCAGTDVHHVVGGQHHVLVVLHHDHRVAGIAQLFERMDQSYIVSLVKPDRGFVENIEHIHQL